MRISVSAKRPATFDRKAWTELAYSLLVSLSLILAANWMPSF